MNNNQLKNILKLAMNLSLKENKEIIPYLQKAFNTVQLNEQKNKIIKNKKENVFSNNPETAKNNIKLIDNLIKKESEILNKKFEKEVSYQPKDQMFLD